MNGSLLRDRLVTGQQLPVELTAAQLAALSTAQTNALTTEQLGSMSSAQLASLSFGS